MQTHSLKARIQIRKYTEENMARYGSWIEWYHTVDWRKVGIFRLHNVAFNFLNEGQVFG